MSEQHHYNVAHKGMITLSIMLATIMQALDTTIANVALPHMQGALQASQDQITWVLTSYIVAAAIATPLTGWLCGRYGRKQVFLMAVVGFTVASALCGLAESLVQIVLARLLQGIFGAALVPLSQAVLLDINPREKVGQAMALWGAGIMVGPIMGPMLGGWLTDAYDWRWVFYINLPVGLFAFYGIWRYLPDSRPASSKLDLFGFAMLSLSVGFLQMFLDRGEQLDWFSSAEICIEAVGAVVCFTYFVLHTWTAGAQSFFNRALLLDRNFVTGLVFAFIVGVILYATMALLPSLLQGLLGYPVVETGIITAPSGVGTMLAMMIVGRLIHRFDIRAIMAFGFALTAFSLWQMAQMTLDMGVSLVVWSGFIRGLGIGFVFVPLSTATFATLAPQLRNEGTPIYSLLRNLGSSVGISIVQTMLTQGSNRAHANLAEAVNLSNPNLAGLPAMLDSHSAAGLAMLNNEVTRQAAMIGYLDDFHVMMWVTLLAMPLLLLIRMPGKQPAKQDDEAELAHAVLE
ncbi:MFS transporter, DHA2 family, multidrug resistance protein [Andreprevotia lacus DSM 23236]|jgi:DHA2 family multidrug resistance protein|uniref:MFS transporter, DHA2 family, multidrug resistance protein n=1 Tax=Andreprevotia lacus DSM 23236 TaxID=1121001 RepID=A0A1W1X187_9NEIS|nr:DHA2 family efflux MFS transporter permease subunit [Andreprevotia lacus]SMC17667.1 MFS transporter, DHA2 family, multidrug resistance protein [Andreprevotia lacus DSM 23236]